MLHKFHPVSDTERALFNRGSGRERGLAGLRMAQISAPTVQATVPQAVQALAPRTTLLPQVVGRSTFVKKMIFEDIPEWSQGYYVSVLDGAEAHKDPKVRPGPYLTSYTAAIRNKTVFDKSGRVWLKKFDEYGGGVNGSYGLPNSVGGTDNIFIVPGDALVVEYDTSYPDSLFIQLEPAR